MTDLIHEVEIPNYPDKIKLSEKRRATYHDYRKKSKLPKKYQTEQYEWRGKFLYDKEINQRVVKNSLSVGTPKWWTVNFQDIWVGMHYLVRSYRMNKLKNIFRRYIEVLEPITEFPIRFEIFLLSPKMPVDVDNKGVIYTKILKDLLVNTNKGELNNHKVIPDDSSKYVNDTGRCKWIEIDENEIPKMIIRIWKSNNQLI